LPEGDANSVAISTSFLVTSYSTHINIYERSSFKLLSTIPFDLDQPITNVFVGTHFLLLSGEFFFVYSIEKEEPSFLCKIPVDMYATFLLSTPHVESSSLRESIYLIENDYGMFRLSEVDFTCRQISKSVSIDDIIKK